MSELLRPFQRVRKSETFRQAVRYGTFARGRLLHLWALPLDKLTGSGRPKDVPEEAVCLGVIVSRRVHLRANRRNLWKRRIRESFRRNQNRFRPGRVLVFQARRTSEVPDYGAIERELVRLAAQVKALERS